MIKIEKDIKILLAIEDPEIYKLREEILSLTNKYPELENNVYVLSINKINEEIKKYIKNLNKIIRNKEEAKLPLFVISLNAYTNMVDDFVKALKDFDFTDKKQGIVIAILGIDDPEIHYQLDGVKYAYEEIIRKDLENGKIGAMIDVIDINDVEKSKKYEQYIKEINKRIYGKEGLKLPVFGIFYTYCTDNVAEFETFYNYIKRLT